MIVARFCALVSTAENVIPKRLGIVFISWSNRTRSTPDEKNAPDGGDRRDVDETRC